MYLLVPGDAESDIPGLPSPPINHALHITSYKLITKQKIIFVFYYCMSNLIYRIHNRQLIKCLYKNILPQL